MEIVSVVGRWSRCWQMLLVALLRVRSVGRPVGGSGASAGVWRSQAVLAAGRPRQPHLGSLRWSHHAAFGLGVHEPRGELPRRHGVQVWHEGWVLYSSWLKHRNSEYWQGFRVKDSYGNSMHLFHLLPCRWSSWGPCHSPWRCRPLRTRSL